MARKTKRAKRSGKVKFQPESCLCGCGGPLKKGRMFLQGHDAKLKSLVLRVKAGKAQRSEIPRAALPILRSKGVGGIRLSA